MAGHSEPTARTVPEPARSPELSILTPTKGGTRVPSPARSAVEQAATGQPDTLEEALNNASIMEDHRALMGVVLKRIQSVNSGLKEAFSGLLMGFEVSNVIVFTIK